MKKVYLLFIILFCSAANNFAQDLNYGVWSQVKTSFDLSKDLEGAVSGMYRQDLQTPGRRAYIGELAVKYDLAKKWSVEAEYRLKKVPSESTQRVAIAANFREGMGDFDLYFRTKLQHEFLQYAIPETAWRNRVKMRFDHFKKIKPYVSYELFLNRNYKEINLTTYRAATGVDYNINKHNGLEVYLIVDQEIYNVYPVTDLIFGVSYEYKFK